MKAIVQDRYGPPATLRLSEVDKPVAGDDEVLVRVEAASVNARDWHTMRGDPYVARLALGFRGPKDKIPGTDFAGRVEAVGSAVTRFAAGDEVFGEVAGAFAEYVRVPATLVEPKPVGFTFEQAAALPLAGNTALMGLRDLGRVGPGRQVLINGASGGVGTFAVQLAKAFGASVTGVCSTRNVELVRSLGADHVVDYTRDDFARGTRRYDVVFDLVGNRSLADCRRALTPQGMVILSGGGVFEGGSLFGPIGLILKGVLQARLARRRILVLSTAPTQENLATLRELAEAGKITAVIDRRYPLSETAEALRYVEGEHARAKVVITV